MSATVTMPKLGMTMESAKIQVWLKADGDEVGRDEPILSIETEKAIAEVTAPAPGILLIRARPGDELPVGALIAELAANRAEYEALRSGAPPAPATEPDAARPPAGVPSEAAGPAGARAGGGKVRVAPVARALAAEHGIDLSAVTGTGPEGRITKDDVLAHLEAGAISSAATPPPGLPAGVSPVAGGRTRLVARTARRQIVAARMMEAVRETAQTTHAMDVDATSLVGLRQEMLARMGPETDVRITVTDLLVKATALALRRHPILNSVYTEEGDVLVEDVHIGLAASVGDDDLLVPVIRDADKKSVEEIARTRIALLERARQDRLLPDDLTGSTFTLSSLGMFGLDRFVAIINRPENAILAVGAILDRPWVHDGDVTVRKVMTLTLTYDHRTIYGAEAARFMATLRAYLEAPETALSPAATQS